MGRNRAAAGSGAPGAPGAIARPGRPTEPSLTARTAAPLGCATGQCPPPPHAPKGEPHDPQRKCYGEHQAEQHVDDRHEHIRLGGFHIHAAVEREVYCMCVL